MPRTPQPRRQRAGIAKLDRKLPQLIGAMPEMHLSHKPAMTQQISHKMYERHKKSIATFKAKRAENSHRLQRLRTRAG
jgi:hypothetical protein